MIAANPSHQLDAIIGPERQVDDGHIGLRAVDGELRRLHRSRFARQHEFTLPRQQLLQPLAYEWMVIDDQDPCWIGHISSSSAGALTATPTSTFSLAAAQGWSNPHFPQCSHGDTLRLGALTMQAQARLREHRVMKK